MCFNASSNAFCVTKIIQFFLLYGTSYYWVGGVEGILVHFYMEQSVHSAHISSLIGRTSP